MIKRWFSARKEQTGSSIIQLLCYLLSSWLVLTVLLRLIPIYFEHRTIVSVLEKIVSEYDPSTDSTAVIEKKLNAAWSDIAVDQVDPESIVIERKRSKLTLAVQYDARFSVLGDVVGVWMFDERVTTP